MDEELKKFLLALQARTQTQDATNVRPANASSNADNIDLAKVLLSLSSFFSRGQREVNNRTRTDQSSGPSIEPSSFNLAQLVPLWIRDAFRPAETGPSAQLAQFLGYLSQNIGPEALASGPVAGTTSAARAIRGAAPSLKAIEAAQEIPPLRVPEGAVHLSETASSLSEAFQGRRLEELGNLSLEQSLKGWPSPQESQRQLRGLQQGFNIEAFHGTAKNPITWDFGQTEDFTSFNPLSHFGTKQAAQERLEQIGALGYNSFTGQQASRGTRVFPVRLRGNFVEVEDLGMWEPENVINEVSKRGYIGEDEAVYLNRTLDSIRHSMSDPYRYPRVEVMDRQNEFLYDYLKRTGIDGFQYINHAEDVGSISYMVIEPKNVRSALAQFDPTKTNSNNLLASLAAATVGTAAVESSRKKESR